MNHEVPKKRGDGNLITDKDVFISAQQRQNLASYNELDYSKFIGYDSKGLKLSPADEVICTDEEGNSHQAKVVRYIPGPNSWTVEVEFFDKKGDKKIVLCQDYFLTKLI